MTERDNSQWEIGWALRGLALIATVSGCGTEPDDARVGLMATGTLVAADGTPLANTHIELYELIFFISTAVGEAEITRTFEGDEWGRPMVTDAGGQFSLSEADLALSFDYEHEVQVCSEDCVAYGQVCDDTMEYVCECAKDTGALDCEWVNSEWCESECIETVSECWTETQTDTHIVELEEIVATEAHAWLHNDNGTQRLVIGDTAVGLPTECDEDGQPKQLWLQGDRFVDAAF